MKNFDFFRFRVYAYYMSEEIKKENSKKSEKERDFLLPASILIAAIIVGIALVYNAGKKVDNSNNLAANVKNAADTEQAAAQSGNIPPITDKDHIWGSINAPVKIVVYDDLECPFCKRFEFTLETIKSIYGDQVALVYRHFPLAMLHSKAPQEAQAAECAYKLGGNQAFWDFVKKVYAITPSNNGLDLNELPKIASQVGLDVNQFNACTQSDYGKDFIQSQYNDGVNIGIQGTPYAVVMNNAGKKYVVPGAYPLDYMKNVVDQALKENK